MLAEIVKGKSIEQVKKIAQAVRALLKGEEIEGDIELGDLEALRGVKKFPVRVKCALLSWTTLIDAIETGVAQHHHEHNYQEHLNDEQKSKVESDNADKRKDSGTA